jgi:hypothetical protein
MARWFPLTSNVFICFSSSANAHFPSAASLIGLAANHPSGRGRTASGRDEAPRVYPGEIGGFGSVHDAGGARAGLGRRAAAPRHTLPIQHMG